MKTILSVLLFATFFLFQRNIVYSATQNFETDQKEYFLHTSGGKQLEELVILRNKNINPLSLGLKWKSYSQINHAIDFATLDSSKVSLQPQSSENVVIKFNIPAEIKSGDYYGYLVISDSNSSKEITFTIRVLGRLTEKISLKKISYSPNEIIFDVFNEGTITTLVDGKVKIDNLFSNVRIQNIENLELKAGETKTIKLEKTGLFPGYYRGNIDLKYGTKSFSLNSFFNFWVNSNFFLISILTLVVTMVIFLSFRGLKSDV